MLEIAYFKEDKRFKTWPFRLRSFLFFFFFKLFFNLFIYLFIFGRVGSSFLCEGFLWLWQAGATLHRGRGPLTVAASLVAEHRLQMRRLSNCGSWAQLLRGMWDLPRPGLEPVSPALAGRFSTTAPPGKPQILSLFTLLDQQPDTVFALSLFQRINPDVCV